jgi:D-alanyl-lipoteichoic acid acyltransferase DltB (MBOAT superfamily)
MSIVQILVLTAIALVIGLMRRGRLYGMLTASVVLIYWLQPDIDFLGSNRGFWLASATLALAVAGWFLTAAPETRSWRQNWPAGVAIAGAVLLVDLSRYAGLEHLFGFLTPRPHLTLAFLAGLLLAGLALGYLASRRGWLLGLAGVGILLLFVLIKAPGLMEWFVSKAASRLGVETEGGRIAFSWLGFSYIAFRLLHTFRDRQMGRLPALTLAEYVTYAVFFPAFSAGPIDRAERFVQDVRRPQPLDAEGWLFVGQRFFVGLFKKFVLADVLAFLALNEVFAAQVSKPGWMWMTVYAYAFQIYFDFSGYTDLAIALGRLMGVRLPENFAAPYLKPNLTQFWNAWHMTLTQWFRAYFFNPLTRALRASKRTLLVWLIIFITQVSTMLLIGLWHGIAWNFVLWGLWHGIGLFVQNRWSEWVRPHAGRWADAGWRQKVLYGLGVVLTFHYVALGWVLFVLPVESVPRVFGILLGLAGG